MRRFLQGLALVVLAAAIVSAIVVVQVGRAGVTSHVVGSAALSPNKSLAISENVRLQITGLLWGSAAALRGIFGMALWLLTPGRTGSEPRRMGWLLPPAVAAGAVFRYALAVKARLHEAASADPTTQPARMQAWLEDCLGQTASARLLVWVAMAIALIGIAAWYRWPRRAEKAGVSITTGALVFAIGLAAFAATRPLAADSRPLPVLGRGSMELASSVDLPRFTHCRGDGTGLPWLTFTGTAPALNGMPVDPEKFQDELARWRRTVPPSADGVLNVVADVTTALERIRPYLERSGEGEVFVVGVTPGVFPSRTLGPVPRFEYCAQAFRLVEKGDSLDQYRTLADLSAAMNTSTTTLKFARW